MMQPEASMDAEPTGRYEIRLKGAAPEALRHEFPSATVYTTRTETVLFPQVTQPADLDDLIDQLLSRGFVLTEVHELKAPDPTSEPPQNASSEEVQPDDHNL
jgi:hypothetical protein